MSTPPRVVIENPEALDLERERPDCSFTNDRREDAELPSGPRGSGLAVLMTACLALVVCTAAARAAEPRPPVGVSPGAADRYVASAGRCPTFSWSGGGDTAALELLIYRIEEPGTAEVAHSVPLPPGATSWTPAADRCLSPGRWAWTVRGPDGAASEPLLLEISPRPSQAELERALAVVRAWQDGKTDPGAETASGRGVAGSPQRADARRGSARTESAASLSGATVAISGKRSETSGNAIGVVGETASPDGAGVAAANADPGGGSDLLLDGAAQGIPDTVLTESGLDRPSSGDEVFEFGNSGAGSLSLRLDGVDLVTTLTDEDTLGGLSCASGELPKSDGAGGWSCAADADTSYSAGNQLTLSGTTFDVVEGSSSGLDADLLDGLDSASFAAAVHAHDDRYFTETEMGTSGSASLHWENLASVPSGFADGVDDDTTYRAGNGLLLTGPEFEAGPVALYSPGVFPRANRIHPLEDPGGDSCADALSVAVGIDGSPVVACASASGELLVGICGDPACTTIDFTSFGGTVGVATSTVVTTDRGRVGPALVVYTEGGTLKLLNLQDRTIYGLVSGLGRASIGLGPDGFPIITYSPDSDTVGFLQCHDLNCSSGTQTDIDLSAFSSSADPVTQTAVALGARGLPVVGFLKSGTSSGEIGMVKCGDPACTTLVDGDVVAHNGNATDHPLSMVIDEGGRPVIVYGRTPGGAARLLIFGVGQVNLDPTNTDGEHAAVTVAGDGHLVAAYWDQTGGDLEMVHCEDLNCTTSTTFTADPGTGSTNVGSHVALSFGGDGRPLAIYLDDTGTLPAQALKCANAFCVPFLHRK